MANVFVTNKMSSKDSLIMQLVSRLLIACMKYNIDFRSKHVGGKANYVADKLSEFKFQGARRWAP